MIQGDQNVLSIVTDAIGIEKVGWHFGSFISDESLMFTKTGDDLYSDKPGHILSHVLDEDS